MVSRRGGKPRRGKLSRIFFLCCWVFGSLVRRSTTWATPSPQMHVHSVQFTSIQFSSALANLDNPGWQAWGSKEDLMTTTNFINGTGPRINSMVIGTQKKKKLNLRSYLCARESLHALHPVSAQEFPQCCLCSRWFPVLKKKVVMSFNVLICQGWRTIIFHSIWLNVYFTGVVSTVEEKRTRTGPIIIIKVLR